MRAEIDRVILGTVDETKTPYEYTFLSTNDGSKYLIAEDKIEADVPAIRWHSGTSFRRLEAEDDKFVLERLPDPEERSVAKVRIYPG